ncbi:MAG: hypothetical protein VKK42_11360 [Lyngbya sp.]|nr:hypothetical protein [Lyngbya sp.]
MKTLYNIVSASLTTISVVLFPNLAYAYWGFDNRTDWENTVSQYSIVTEDFNSLIGQVTADSQLSTGLVTNIPFTVNTGEARSDWAAFDIVFPNEVIAFGFDMIDPWRSSNRNALLGNVKFFDQQNNLINHLGVQFTSYDEDFVGFFLGENSGVHRIEYLWCGVYRGPNQPLDYCKAEYSPQQTIDNFSFVIPKSESKAVPEGDAKLGFLAFSLFCICLLKRQNSSSLKN